MRFPKMDVVPFQNVHALRFMCKVPVTVPRRAIIIKMVAATPPLISQRQYNDGYDVTLEWLIFKTANGSFLERCKQQGNVFIKYEVDKISGALVC